MFGKIFHKIKRFIKPIKPNTVDNNLDAWSNWDWSDKGEEWSNNPEWKESLVEYVLLPNIPEDCRVLEIGPGGGRWTEYLITRAKKIALVDLTQKCIELCKERFSNCENIDYFINDGRSLDMIDTESIDRVWSWDVFVHIQASDIRPYISEFSRILVSGGRAIIHHSKNGRDDRGWRSDMTAEKMHEFCNENNLRVVSQFNSWNEGKNWIWPDFPSGDGPDIISIIEKPIEVI